MVGPAAAATYDLQRADITYDVQADGSVNVEERLTLLVHSRLRGAYRLIPDEAPVKIEGLIVGEHDPLAERDLAYSSGGSAGVGSPGPPRTWGAAIAGFPRKDWIQVVWHTGPRTGTRTFVLLYAMRNFVVAYRDVGDLYLRVWGDEWPVALRRLHAEVVLPGGVAAGDPHFRGWSLPASSRGRVRLASGRLVLDASNVPAHRFVELEAVFPRRLLTRTGAYQVGLGDGFPAVLARRARAFVSPFGATPSPLLTRVTAKPRGGDGGGGFPWWVVFLAATVLAWIVLDLRRRFGRRSATT